jgi:hypothetical protein
MSVLINHGYGQKKSQKINEVWGVYRTSLTNHIFYFTCYHALASGGCTGSFAWLKQPSKAWLAGITKPHPKRFR